MVRAIDRRLAARPNGRPVPLNIDGAIAAVCADMGFEPELGNALFMIARVPGLVAHANEERSRQHPMRQIDPKDVVLRRPAAPAAAGDEEIALRDLAGPADLV